MLRAAWEYRTAQGLGNGLRLTSRSMSAYRTAASGGLAKSGNLRDLAMWIVALALFLLGSVILILYGLP